MGIERAWLDRYPAELSGGELQRFCIARALAPGTRFVIADEMSTMLDATSQAQIWDMLLRAAGARGLGVLAVTHSAALAARVSTRVVAFQ
jgi:peptide/nickel transport system ATP-binding protein